MFEPLAPSAPSLPTSSSARRRLSGLINLRSYAASSLLSSRESSSSRNLNRHSIHGSIFRSSSTRGHGATSASTNTNNNTNTNTNTSSSVSASTARPSNPNPDESASAVSSSRDAGPSNRRFSARFSESAAAATIADALNFNGDDILAEPQSITLDTTIVEPIPTRFPASSSRDADPSNRRFSSRFSESAAAALLQARSSGNPSPEPVPEPEPDPDPEPAVVDRDMTRSRSATVATLNEMSPGETLPSIRLSAFQDPRASRPSLSFPPVTRTLPSGKETIKVGRYSERENHVPTPMNMPSAASIGFKSKVVSRRHCEFWSEKGKWYVKDVKSSSGTFLNHIRLSPPGTESKAYPINDGDVVQLGIDFKGGEEMIYRCVKMRVELNRGWQAKPNTFNMATHKHLQSLSATGSGPSHTQDCSICLNAIAPCQSLFVAPCSHTWHYKCIREMLQGPSAPIFMCPNCRATADLEAEVDEPSEEWQKFTENQAEEKAEGEAAPESGAPTSSVPPLTSDSHRRSEDQVDLGDTTMHISNTTTPQPYPASARRVASQPVSIPNGPQRRTPSPVRAGLLMGHEQLTTPRNDAGPWVFDGNPARVSQESTRRNGMASLNAAAQAGPNQI
ncbi:hypothetical protein F4777DRAFT_580239 [Nemania sp. FL0916]|nr:hypothetical protein F4777DRAFT_580239 [Nemania sp. FL0916]